MKRSFAYPVIFMVIITVVFVTILASFNYATVDKIAFNKENDLRQKLLYVFDILPKGGDPQKIEEIFNEQVVEKQFGEKSGYALMEGGKEVKYAVLIDGTGLWGSITGYLGLNDNLTKISGIEFVTQSETPGLGGRISETSYKEQYRDIDIVLTKGKYLISKPQQGGNVDAIAGATQTSTAVVNFINKDLTDFFQSVEVN